MMRRQLIEALTYPRLLVEKIIEERDCPHDSLFHATSERCHQCDVNSECHWVNCLNEFSDFKDKPEYTINASLRYGIKLVESLRALFLGSRCAAANGRVRRAPGAEPVSAGAIGSQRSASL
jgi:hypothetical protein